MSELTPAELKTLRDAISILGKISNRNGQAKEFRVALMHATILINAVIDKGTP